MKSHKKSVFSPIDTIKDYLAGRKVDTNVRRILRKFLTDSLLLSWTKIDQQPDLVIDPSFPIFKLPYLSDREKLWLVVDFLHETDDKYMGLSHYRGCLFKLRFKNGQALIAWEEPEYVEGARTGKLLEREEPLTVTAGEIHEFIKTLRPHDWLRFPPCNFRTLRIYTLLYRPYRDWTCEELAVMSESGIKVAPKLHDDKFYRPDW
ncbi:MAG: hypothetical protein Q8R08_02150 [bacterium]|nr:hypothetical protein [bacterium]